jgi:hypothetical protein
MNDVRRTDQLDPAVTKLMVLAFDQAMNSLILTPPETVQHEMAKRIVAAAQGGERTLSGLIKVGLGASASARANEGGSLSAASVNFNGSTVTDKRRKKAELPSASGITPRSSRTAIIPVRDMLRFLAHFFKIAIHRSALTLQNHIADRSRFRRRRG